MHLRDGGQVLQHFLGVGAQLQAGGVHAETVEEALAPLAQRCGAVGQRCVVSRQQQDHGDVITGQFALDHFLQADQRIAHVIFGLFFQQFGHIGQPVVGVEADTGATAAQQHAVQFGRGARVAAGVQQSGESVVWGILNGHDELGARRRDV